MVNDGTYTREVARALLNQVLSDSLSSLGSLGDIKIDSNWNLSIGVDYGNSLELISKLTKRSGREGRELGWLIYQGGKVSGCSLTQNLGRQANRSLKKLDRLADALHKAGSLADKLGKANALAAGAAGIAKGATCASNECAEKCDAEQASRQKKKSDPWYKFW